MAGTSWQNQKQTRSQKNEEEKLLGSSGTSVTVVFRGFNKLTEAETPGTPRTVVVRKHPDHTFSFRLERLTA